MRAAISLLVLLLSRCGVPTESQGTDASTQDVSAELKELRDMMAELKTQVDNLRRENAAQEAELTAIRAAPKVAFSAALRDWGFSHKKAETDDLDVVFNKVITNVGEAYSSETGFFTAPVRGVYYVRFTAMDKLDTYVKRERFMSIRMHKNGELLMQLWEKDNQEFYVYLSSGLTLQLEKGDTVNMVIPKSLRISDSNEYQSTFSGFLLFPLGP
ncbi:complement C1q-like protein 2 [Engraulis encrasicolus]|uniref:complement C1q-like protein 2 n=1 Tax=Engraulis encrasicolus TaxID=184585 RepID=UPI002FD55F63